ncbi:MAG: type I pantothenate kinase [Alphaproteobacteria bacterium]|nr:type I pantothenate kinase [Alphaproteobacteria bacterium]
MPDPAAMDEIVARLRELFLHGDDARGKIFVLAVTGSVAVGKTTFAEGLRDHLRLWPEHPIVEIVSTDGFLFANTQLAEKGLSHRKGFPESFDAEALRRVLRAARSGSSVIIPRYSHVTYDVDPQDSFALGKTDILILDGLHLGRLKFDTGKSRLIDVLIYLDAKETHIEGWFAARLAALMGAGRDDPHSFYHAFRELDEGGVQAFISRVWNGINLPNLREHIVKDRDLADIVVEKDAGHAITAVRSA